ncbi:hypothetical protein B0H11DRAFT_2214100 [Mycena galericulata]|nr:hypothetical protein B0H11DRAFT_2214100 [Mycena galericulata]
MARPAAASHSAERTASTTVKKARDIPAPQTQRQLESHRAASARYRERNRAKVLEAGRKRAAEYVPLFTVSPEYTGSKVDHRRRAKLKNNEEARERARQASARYRGRNREELALQQRQVRKRAFIKKHGIHAYIQRRFDAPPRTAAVSTSEEEDPDAEALRNFVFYDGTNCSNAPIIISEYEDPFFPRR